MSEADAASWAEVEREIAAAAKPEVNLAEWWRGVQDQERAAAAKPEATEAAMYAEIHEDLAAIGEGIRELSDLMDAEDARRAEAQQEILSEPAAWQARAEAQVMELDVIEHVLATSDPTLRAVFAEDAAALIGLLIAAAGLGLHQITGSPTPDAIGSILVGVLLGVVAVVLINRNRRFLVGQEADPRVRAAVIEELLEQPEVARVTYLRLEVVGPRLVSVVGDVDLTGDDTESHVAYRLRELEARITASPAVAGTVLSLSTPDEPSIGV